MMRRRIDNTLRFFRGDINTVNFLMMHFENLSHLFQAEFPLPAGDDHVVVVHVVIVVGDVHVIVIVVVIIVVVVVIVLHRKKGKLQRKLELQSYV